MASDGNPYFKTNSEFEFVSRKSKKKRKPRTKQFSTPEELESESDAMQSKGDCNSTNDNNDNENDSEAASDDASTKEVTSPLPSALLLSPPVSLDAFASAPPQLDREKILEPEYYPDPNDVKYQEQESKLSPSVSGDETEVPTLLNTKALSKHAKTYELEKFEKNVLIIFNQKKIDGHQTRLGTEKDVEALTRTFSKYDFEVVEHLDFTKKQIEDELKAFSRRNFTDYGCVAVAILTHGSNNGLLRAKDQQYSEVEIIKHFKVVNKPTLVTKPKIIIIQACRGSVIVPGAAVMRAGKVRRDLDEPIEPYILPVESDMLILHSSYSGSPSHRNDIHGSWFIQELCNKIDSRAATEDLESIVTEVKREVAINKQHEEYNRRTLEIDINKQMPVITSTLIRKLFLRRFGEKPMPLPTFMDGKRDSVSCESGQDSFDNAVSNTPFLVQLGPCSCFLDYFNYLRNCLRHFCVENQHDDAAQHLLDIADTFEEGDQFNTSKQKMIKAISKHIVNNAHSCPYFPYLYINKQG